MSSDVRVAKFLAQKTAEWGLPPQVAQQLVEFVVRRKERASEVADVRGVMSRIPSGNFAGQSFSTVQCCWPDPDYDLYHSFCLRFSETQELIGADYLLG